MPSRRVCIVGGGLGGLSLAVRLRAAGLEVTLYEANERVGGRANLIAQDGFRFDTGPSLVNYPWVYEELFASAGRKMSDYVELLPVDPSIRFLWPDGTDFTLSSHLGFLLKECERVEPGSGAGLLAFLHDAERKFDFAFRKLVTRNADNALQWASRLTPADLLRSAAWRSLNGELGRFFRSRYLREALGSYAMYLGGSPWTLPGLFSILPYGELSQGLWLPRGGIYALVEGVARLATELGAVIRTGRRARRIRTEGGRVSGVEFDDGAVDPAETVVSNVDVPTTQRELLGRDDRVPAMTPGVVTFYWGVRGEVRGLRHHTIFLPDDFRDTFDDLLVRKRIPANLAFYVSAASATDASLAPPGDTALFALAPVPLLSDLGAVDWPAAVSSLKQRMMERMQRQGAAPDPARIVFERVYTPDDWRRQFGLYDGSAFGAAHSLFQLGPFRSPNRDRRAKGLYYVGAGTTPGTGLPMVVLGSKMTAERVLADAR